MRPQDLGVRRRQIVQLRRLSDEDSEEMWPFSGHRPGEVRECANAALRALGMGVVGDGRRNDEAH
jgi:hypothetical protein